MQEGERFMTIVFEPEIQQFHLANDQISYVFRIMENRQLEHLYFGKRLSDACDLSYLSERGHRDMQVCSIPGNPYFSLEHIRQEYPAYGTGDMRYPAYQIEGPDGNRSLRFAYRSHTVYAGKKPIPGLPATYVEEPEEAQTVEIHLSEPDWNIEMVLFYTIYASFPAVIRHTEFYNRGERPVTLENAMSLSLDLPDKEYDMLELAGTWGRERHIRRRRLDYGIQSVYSLRGHSSHQFNPFLALLRPGTSESSGEAIGVSLVYSGDFLAQAEVDNFDVTRVCIGIHPQEFSWKLDRGESFCTPEAVAVYSDQGCGGMSQAFHRLYQSRLARGYWRDRVRPILINNWEATYFDFDEEKLLQIARKAQEIGVELFVLDDGWFGKRSSSRSSLGDWFPNLEKLPDGITGISRKIHEMGMKFGLWFKPEMVNEDSDLYRQHPDWILGDPSRNPGTGRGQYVLDFSRKEVVDSIYHRMDDILSSAQIDYIKWDCNRSFSDVFSNGRLPDQQGKTRHLFLLGVYDLYERLTRKFPEILFESCASGGARFDPGMLFYAPQAWASDDTDAVERLKIQYGTSMVYPLSSIGSHVSKIPNEQVFRNTPLRMRGAAAYFGTFGYELDLTKLGQDELEQMKGQIAFMKKNRRLLQFGTFFRLRSPFEGDGNTTAWMVVSPDRTEALVAYYRVLQRPEAKYERLPLRGLQEEFSYEVSECMPEDGAQAPCERVVRGGDELMQIGWILSDASSGKQGNPKRCWEIIWRVCSI